MSVIFLWKAAVEVHSPFICSNQLAGWEVKAIWEKRYEVKVLYGVYDTLYKHKCQKIGRFLVWAQQPDGRSKPGVGVI
jgi:hypothetical protein